MREFDLLRHIYSANPSLPSRVTIPPGDDMGAVRIGDIELLVTVDQLADGLHFNLDQTAIRKIGRKAITRNLSDVAAMAAVPVGAVAAGCLPRGFGEARASELFDAMRETAAAYDCPIIGGDLSMWDHPLIITVTIFAQSGSVAPVLRRGACPGDLVYVTGALGGSTETIDGYTHHLDFEPRLRVARTLATDPVRRPHAMIDLSDGLGRDLGHICTASGVAAEIDADRLPISPAAEALARRKGDKPWQHAVGDGEDYELCFTVPPSASLPDQIEGVRLARIGRIVPAQPGRPLVTLRFPDGSTRSADELGWEHHA